MVARRTPAAATRRRKAEQIELFPEPARVERVPVTGARTTSTKAIHRVVLGYAATVHLVYHDRHGVYCEEHGRECRAVRVVTARDG